MVSIKTQSKTIKVIIDNVYWAITKSDYIIQQLNNITYPISLSAFCTGFSHSVSRVWSILEHQSIFDVDLEIAEFRNNNCFRLCGYYEFLSINTLSLTTKFPLPECYCMWVLLFSPAGMMVW